jgi:hypothetical protein
MSRVVRHVSFCLVLCCWMAGCGFSYSEYKERNRLMKEQYPSYPERVQQALAGNYLLQGMTHDQVYLALGEPHCKGTALHKDKRVEDWMYPPDEGSPCTLAHNHVYFDKGQVVGWSFGALGF